MPQIPIIGNGDVTEPGHVTDLMRVSGCAGVMIARGAMRTPWIFRRAKALLDTGTVGPEPTFPEKLTVVLRHLELCRLYNGEQRAAIRMRQHVAWYGKSMGHIKYIKEAIRVAPDCDTIEAILRTAQVELADVTTPSVPFSRTRRLGDDRPVPEDFDNPTCRGAESE